MARALILIGIAGVAFWVFSLVHCALQTPDRHRGVPKPAWVVIVALLPVVGGILWLTIGFDRRSTSAARPVVAPDDDPVFLGGVSSMTDAERADQDARIRELEEELARLETEEQEADAPAADDSVDDQPAEGDARDVHRARGDGENDGSGTRDRHD